jgi:uncharacterized membrane protein YcaP (DUF421 family)
MWKLSLPWWEFIARAVVVYIFLLAILRVAMPCKIPRIGRFVEGRPQVIVHNGRVYRDVMESERLTQDELDAAVRLAGCASIHDVHFAILENNGQISVRLRT